MLCTKEP